MNINEKLEKFERKRKSKRLLIITIVSISILLPLILMIPMEISVLNGRVVSDPKISKSNISRYLITLGSALNGKYPRSFSTKYDCRIQLDSGINITAACNKDTELGVSVKVGHSKPVYTLINKNWRGNYIVQAYSGT